MYGVPAGIEFTIIFMFLNDYFLFEFFNTIKDTISR